MPTSLDQADRLYRMSALFDAREKSGNNKWEAKSYRLATLQKALRLFMVTM